MPAIMVQHRILSDGLDRSRTKDPLILSEIIQMMTLDISLDLRTFLKNRQIGFHYTIKLLNNIRQSPSGGLKA